MCTNLWYYRLFFLIFKYFLTFSRSLFFFGFPNFSGHIDVLLPPPNSFQFILCLHTSPSCTDRPSYIEAPSFFFVFRYVVCLFVCRRCYINFYIPANSRHIHGSLVESASSCAPAHSRWVNSDRSPITCAARQSTFAMKFIFPGSGSV